MSAPKRFRLSRPAFVWAVSCLLCSAALAEMALDNQAAKPVRSLAKQEIKLKEWQ